jgi:hypothetical protein
MWIMDKLTRNVQAACMLVPTKLEWHARSGVVMMRLKRDACSDVQPGQYLFINIPTLSLNEWRVIERRFHLGSLPYRGKWCLFLSYNPSHP